MKSDTRFILRLKSLFGYYTVASEQSEKLNRIELLIGSSIGSPDLYLKALRHRSKLADEESAYHNDSDSYEQLEFLGDAVLDLIVTEFLFDRFPDENEGFMTKIRAKIVKGDSLARLSRYLDLGELIEVGNRVKGQGIEFSNSVLADIFEAVVGAVYRDKGYQVTFQFVKTVIERYVDLEKLIQVQDNYKSLLLEYAQSQRMTIPEYGIIAEMGPAHDKTFRVKVTINNKVLGEGKGKNKKTAEQQAAKIALQTLQKNHK